MLQSILIWSALGLVAGMLAKLIMPGKQGMNPITTVLLGIATAVAGALLLMFLWGLLFGKK